MAKYNTFAELAQAYDLQVGTEEGELVAHVDNDVITVTDVDHPETDLLELHPHELIEQALNLLGITAEDV